MIKPLLFPSSIFFVYVSFFISSNFEITLGLDDSRYVNCSSSFSCGEIENVKYPFWGGERAEYCGRGTDFELKCQSNVPKITINSSTYRILDLNATETYLRIARDDFWETQTVCPIDYSNSTTDLNLFTLIPVVVDLMLYYNCNDFNFPGYPYISQDCNRSGKTIKVYYVIQPVGFINPLAAICSAIVIPVLQTHASTYASATFINSTIVQEVLKNGFELRYTVDQPCETCVESGGACGFNQSFTCFCKDRPYPTSCPAAPSTGSSRKHGHLTIAIGGSIGFIGVVIIAIVIIYSRKRCLALIRQSMIIRNRPAFQDYSVETFMKTYGSLAPRRYNFSEVKIMTKSFERKLGQGGYGVVYKAILSDNRLAAVKVLKESKGSGEEFVNEVASISRTSHVNIVTLLGFCYERNKRALIYEYMPNGSLDKFIQKRGSPDTICNLEWKTMYQIAIGIARGLEYLHRGCNTRILHLDIKPQNVLLDADFCPKISDFGLSKVCQRKESIVSILGTRGTVGYIAPEVFSRTFGGISHKSDVYSYGMLIIEMVGGRKNFDSKGSNTSEMYFPDWIYKDLEEDNTNTSHILEEENETVRKMTLIGLWCVQINPSDRPAMSKVVEMLEGPVELLPFPPKPYLCSPVQFSNGSSIMMLETNTTINLEKNEITRVSC